MYKKICSILVVAALIMTAAVVVSCKGDEDCAHTWTDGDVTAATCVAAGSTEQVCSQCNAKGEPKTIAINPEAHDYQPFEGSAQAATCTDSGKEADMKCSRCDDLVQGNVIEALGHDESTKTVNGLCARTGCTSPLLYALGDTGPGGGKIFYIAPAGFTVEGYTGTTGSFPEYTAHYLEVAPENAVASPQQWSLDFTLITGLTSYANTDELNAAIAAGVTGNGRKDTQIIIAELGTNVEYAARSASTYTTDSGHTDWFLPSVTELNLLYQSGSAISDMPDDIFWSSSVSTGSMVWIQFFSDGYLHEQIPDNPVAAVRSVRAF